MRQYVRSALLGIALLLTLIAAGWHVVDARTLARQLDEAARQKSLEVRETV